MAKIGCMVTIFRRQSGRAGAVALPSIPNVSSTPKPMTSRIEKIREMLSEDPSDTFLRYSLAMELAKQGEHTESLERLDALTKDATPYVPAFFMAAQQLVDLERVSEARTYLRDGIEAARAQGDRHAAAEMSEYLAMLGEHGE